MGIAYTADAFGDTAKVVTELKDALVNIPQQLKDFAAALATATTRLVGDPLDAFIRGLGQGPSALIDTMEQRAREEGWLGSPFHRRAPSGSPTQPSKSGP